jgi:hypothetical protein
MALGPDGDALNHSRYAESGQRLEGSQATSSVTFRSGRSSPEYKTFLLAKPSPLNIKLRSDRLSMFNKERDIRAWSSAGFTEVDMYNAGHGNQFENITIPAGDPGSC